jgi:hypothetical protein
MWMEADGKRCFVFPIEKVGVKPTKFVRVWQRFALHRPKRTDRPRQSPILRAAAKLGVNTHFLESWAVQYQKVGVRMATMTSVSLN